MDAVIICVPTPLDQRREPDLSYVEETARAIRPHLQRGQLVVLESTTYPGTTEELVLPILEETGMNCPIAHGPDAEQIATDFFLAFSPEREDPGNKQYGLAQIPKVVGGSESRRRDARRWRCTRRSWPGWCRSARRTRRRWPSCSRIFSAA